MAAQPNLQAVRFDLEVTIERPVEDVFAYVSEVTNLPDWQESARAEALRTVEAIRRSRAALAEA